MARVGWPSLPAGVLVDEIRDWWDGSRQAWSRRVHGFYRTLGRGVTWPLRTAWHSMTGPPLDPLAAFQRQERAAIVTAVEKLLDELDRLAQVGNEVLRPRLLRLLGGRARATLLDRVQAAHENLPAVDEHYRDFLRAELNAWRSSNPRAVRFLQSLDHAAALARPAITVALFFTGLHFAGDLVGQAAAHAASATAGHLAAEAAIAGGITGGGEALVSTTSEGVRQAAGRLFGRLQSRYAQQRAGWLAGWLERELLGELLADLRRGAEVPQATAFRKWRQSRRRSSTHKAATGGRAVCHCLEQAVRFIVGGAALLVPSSGAPWSMRFMETALPAGKRGEACAGRILAPAAVAVPPVRRREAAGQIAAAGELEKGLQVEHLAPGDVAGRFGPQERVEIGRDGGELFVGRQWGVPSPVLCPTSEQSVAAAQFGGEGLAEPLAAGRPAQVSGQIQIELPIARAPLPHQLGDHGVAVAAGLAADQQGLGFLR